MKKTTLLIACVCLLFSTFAQGGEMNKLTKKEISQGWKLLFDGKTLNGWRMFQGGTPTGWHVVDGVLNNSGVGSDHGGDLITTDKYQNFELYLEWKISPQSNSGVFYHVDEANVKAIYESGPEYQLIDDKGWPDKIQDYQHTASNYAMHAANGAEVKPVGEWNVTRIIVNGPHVEHYLNGKKVVEYELWSDEWKKEKEAGKWNDKPYYGMSKTGYIGFQDHGGLCQFRNIKIRTLK